MIRQRKLQVVEVEIQAAEDDANGGVKGAAVGDGLVVFGVDVSTEGWVGAADVRDGLGLKFLLDARFAEDKDFVLVGWEREDAGDVDRG